MSKAAHGRKNIHAHSDPFRCSRTLEEAMMYFQWLNQPKIKILVLSFRLCSTLGERNNNNISNWTVSFSTIKNDGSVAAYCKVYRMWHWSNRFLNQTSRSSFMVIIICVIWNNKLSNLYKIWSYWTDFYMALSF